MRPAPIRADPFVQGGTLTFVENASKARFNGVEVEAQYKPTPDLHFFLSGGYLDGKYLNWNDANGNDLRPFKNLRYAAKWNFSFGTEYTIPVGGDDNRFVIGAHLKYLDKYATESGKDMTGLNREIIPSHTSVDSSVSYYGNLGGKTEYKISAFVNDAFHGGGRVVRSSEAGPFWFGDRVPNRTWGLEVQVEF